MSATRRQLVNAALHSALRLPPEDLRVLVEILRRVAGGAPLEHVLDAMIGERAVPDAWIS